MSETLNSKQNLTCLIVDDQALIRSGFKMILESTGQISVVGEGTNGAEAISLAKELNPDIILMDIRMPFVDGIEATRSILANAGENGPKVLILTTFDLDEYVYQALRAGASGFLLKDTDPDELVSAVMTIAAGDALLAPSVTRRLISRFAQGEISFSEAEEDVIPDEIKYLTERELEVLGLVAKGLSNSELADELFISVATAKTHVSRIMSKCGVHDRAQLVVLAYETGFARAGKN